MVILCIYFQEIVDNNSESDYETDYETSVFETEVLFVNKQTQTTKIKTTIPNNMVSDNMMDSEIYHLTGFDRKTIFLIYQLVGISQNEFDSYMSINNQIILVFMKYRHGMNYLTLSFFYKTDRDIVSKIFVYWTRKFYEYFKSIDFWNLRKKITTNILR